MGNGNYEVWWEVMSWGHGMFSAHEVGGLLWTRAPLSKYYLLLQNNPKPTKLITQY